MDTKQLQKYCNRIHKIVGKNSISNGKVSNATITDYYSKSSFFYRKFHSAEGAIHLPIEYSSKTSHKEKLLFQAKTIHDLINNYNYSRVLELGCGMGFNSRFLAKNNPSKHFLGLDLTRANIQVATEKSQDLDNIEFHQRDFDEQTSFENEPFDLIFGVETLCHSKNIDDLLQYYSEKLALHGRIVIFDAYVKNDSPALDPSELEAYRLLSWGFALDKFQNLSAIQDSQGMTNLSIENTTEYSENIFPNLSSFQKGAIRTLRFPSLLKILLFLRIIPLALIKQLCAGLFGTHFLSKGYLGYYQLEIAKNKK